MSKKKIALIMILAACGIFGIALLLYEWDARQLPPLVTAAQGVPQSENNVPAIADPLHERPDQYADPESTPVLEEERITNSTSKSIGPNTIIIRNRAFPYKNNVDEATLKKILAGWIAPRAPANGVFRFSWVIAMASFAS